MGRKSAPMGSRYGRVCGELLEMGARVAVRSYGHCPQTGRMYCKPPSTPATVDGSGNGEGATFGGSGTSSAAAAAAARRQKQAAATATARRQQQAAAKVEFHGSEFILYGGGQD
ncbi:hypothetical protein BAE44_0007196 [Dichanthelium oligosanthes]|uniref:Uncharacterized protein n=1 Tax=Dichanthelium oligosanthes TaxID=888268 RepID=A0A1E5W3A7_9POAL|nr:hypothetical protein BAE44_0007196 [Dichanthelium oligosanthes]